MFVAAAWIRRSRRRACQGARERLLEIRDLVRQAPSQTTLDSGSRGVRTWKNKAISWIRERRAAHIASARDGRDHRGARIRSSRDPDVPPWLRRLTKIRFQVVAEPFADTER